MKQRPYPAPALLTAALLPAMTLLPPASAAPPTYNITDLGTLGGTNSYALAINSSDVVVGASDTGTALHAFRYTLSLTDLGTLPAPYNANSVAFGINAAGQIVGASDRGSGVSRHAFRTATGGTVTTAVDLGAFGPSDPTSGPDDSEALGINSSGLTVGDSFPAYVQATQPFLYDTSLSAALIPNNGSALGINDSNQFVGYTYYDYGFETRTVAFLTNGGSLTYLGPMSSTSGGPNSTATAINNSGQVVGYLDYSQSGYGYAGLSHGFLYDSTSGTTTDLGTTPYADTSAAFALNNGGAAVGTAYNSGAQSQLSLFGANYAFGHAVLFQSRSAYDLNDLLAGPGSSAWTVETATGINGGGKIVGFGTINGNRHAFLLTPTGTLASPPSAPTGLTAAPTSSPHSINLTFTDTTRGHALFVIERETGGGAFAQVGTAPAGSSTFTDTSNLTADTTYTYRIKARESIGDSSYAVSQPVTTPAVATDVSTLVTVTRAGFHYIRSSGEFAQIVTLTNHSGSAIPGPISLVLDNLQANLVNVSDGVTDATFPAGSPYLNVTANALPAGAKATVLLFFTPQTQSTGDGEEIIGTTALPLRYTTRVLAGTGPR